MNTEQRIRELLEGDLHLRRVFEDTVAEIMEIIQEAKNENI